MNPFLLPKGISLNNYPMSYLLSVSAVTYTFRTVTAFRNTQPAVLDRGREVNRPIMSPSWAKRRFWYRSTVSLRHICRYGQFSLWGLGGTSVAVPINFRVVSTCLCTSHRLYHETYSTLAIVSSMHGLVRVDKLSLYFQTTGGSLTRRF